MRIFPVNMAGSFIDLNRCRGCGSARVSPEQWLLSLILNNEWAHRKETLKVCHVNSDLNQWEEPIEKKDANSDGEQTKTRDELNSELSL